MNAVAANTRESVSYVHTSRGIEPKYDRPKTISDARRIIEETFHKNRWDERSQRVFMEMKGVTPKSLAACLPDEVRTLLNALDESHMVIFNEV